MTGSARLRPALRWIVLGSAGVVLLVALLLLSVTVAADAGYLRQPVVAVLSSLLNRPIRVDGTLHCRLLSSHPRLVADQVTISNPQWMPDGITARIRHVALDLAWPGHGHSFRIDRLEIEGTSLNLLRDAAGHSNWQLQPPHHGGPAQPLIRSLSMRNVQTELDDERHHLRFHGVISAADDRSQSDPWLRIYGVGQLNGSDTRFAIVGDPLNVAQVDRPYRFTYMEHSHDAQLSGRGSLAGAFRFKKLQSDFQASGGNLRDLYQLAGISLINTGPFQLTGTLVRDGNLTRFEQLRVTSADSDLGGTVTVDSADKQRQITLDLSSRLLRLSDLGARAAQGESAALPTPLVLSSEALKPAVMRHSDASIQYHAQRLEAARFVLQELNARATLTQGILTIQPLTAAVMGGKLNGQLSVDARQDDPADNLQLQLTGLQLGQLDGKPQKAPRFDATVDARLAISGHGSSLHQLGASANGRLLLTVPRGVLRTSLAELSGLDLRGLGLLLTASQRETPMRCGAASFDAVDGTLRSQDIVLDTDEVLIRGSGSLALENESLAIRLTGHPKHTRLLRVRAPLLIGGTLRHPTVGVETPHSMQLIDRGGSRDVDCNALPSAAAAPASP